MMKIQSREKAIKKEMFKTNKRNRKIYRKVFIENELITFIINISLLSEIKRQT